ncbi:HAMP domain-containing sensor histidine kinase [Anaerobacillus sp. 1_MG-2023]|uniref:sensor histidine kinase n=1 Tax=Bacillales TaxID=1385 RepID=UPI0026E1C7B7|nr:HAMP domain-containing sensor histidine kinase [Anaerobacillus sp. 1_MG-2023]MDO6658447.1 HAMP domain-containing sensor histidine kinase [Anaerobacillus sp. 1_MG-2023]
MDHTNLNVEKKLPLMPEHYPSPCSLEEYNELIEKLEALAYENKTLSTVHYLVAGVAHEIKNPLTIMKGFLQLIKPDLDKLQKNDIADLLLSEIHRTNTLIEEFLQAARPIEHIKERIDVVPFLKNIILLFHSQATLNRCDITTNLNHFSEPLEVTIDSGQFKQVFLNMIKNSIESIRSSNKENGKISLSIAKRLHSVTIKISDNGAGMDTSTQQKVFQPFYTTKEKGTGLGLFLCKQIIQNHKGTIKVSSAPSFGTTFTIQLPLTH